MTALDRMASTAGQSVPTSKDAAQTAEALATLTEQGKAIGTPYYMAPEQLRSEGIDGRADQFAWGVMAYELLTARGPWQKDATPLVTVSEILSLKPPPPIEIEATIPRRWSDAIVRALSKQRGDRFATMEALLVSLAQPPSATVPIAHQAVTDTRTPPSLMPRQPRTRRGGAIALAMGVLAAGGGVLVLRTRPHPAPVTAAAPIGCTNRSCVESHGGEPYVCRVSDGTCAAIASEDCTPMYEPGDLTSEDTVWLGAMFPTKGPEMGAGGPMNMRGTDLARKEIAEATRELEGSSASPRVRRIALVGCDDSLEGMRAAKHLVDDVRVPAILGFRSGKELIDIAGSLLIKKGVLAVASLTPNPQATRLPQPAEWPKMVWRTTYSDDRVAEAMARILEGVLEPKHPDGKCRASLFSVIRDVEMPQ